MKNIMIIDGAENCVYDVFSVPDDDFALIFPGDTDIAFIEDVKRRADAEAVFEALTRAWPHRIPKREAVAIHGISFYELYAKRKYYPTLRDEEAVNPDGSQLRQAPHPIGSGDGSSSQ